MKVFETVKKTVAEHNLINVGDRVLIGLSGGADSTALLHILYRLSKEFDFSVACAHVNHRLRETAERDMGFAKELCEKLGVDFFSKTVDIAFEAKKAGMSCELYARNVRYEFFDSLGFDKIATAHNKNDVAETLLLNFMRGASMSGLCGIPYRRKNIIRPLLNVKKSEIFEFCRENGYEFVTDETNFEELYTRNKVRLSLIPKIEEINPNFVNVAARNARLTREDADFLDRIAEKEYNKKAEISHLCALERPIARRVLELYWKETTGECENLSADYLDKVLLLAKSGKTGKSLDLPGGYSARCEYGKLIFEKKKEKVSFEYEICHDIALNIPEIGKTVTVKRADKGADFYLSEKERLWVRSRKIGDVFYPTGMSGKKKLSDFFTDKKIPQNRRDEIPILVTDQGIIAVGDMRFDRRFSNSFEAGYKIEIKENADAQEK